MDVSVLQEIALAVNQARGGQEVLGQVVEGLAQVPGIALARIWLLDEGDICETCDLRSECPDQARCLHLVASAGRSVVNPDHEWSRLDGPYRRFPLSVRKVGRIGATGAAALLPIGPEDESWLRDPDWARSEQLRCFAGQPLVFRGETLGVLAIFTRTEFGMEELGWLRTFADQAAVAIANARAFEELDSLRKSLELERNYLREEVRTARAMGGIIGESPAMQTVLEQVRTVAPTDATVLIQGESGTGKELVATAIHENSERKDRPLVRVNCASIPHELFESEFFGHEKGAFTGAVRDRAGRFQIAHRGTLFLDEVGEIPLELQGKLLRALQEGQFSRVGEDKEREVDVRVLAATNRDLKREVQKGRFREDLYYRLTVFPLTVPPLRERRSDVGALVEHFLALAARDGRLPRRRKPLHPGQVESLQQYDWPGNVRELQNVVERALIGARKGTMNFDLPRGSMEATSEPHRGADAPLLMTIEQMKSFERDNLRAVLNRHRWKVAGPGGAAEFLGIPAATLTSRLKSMGIHRPRTS